MSARMSSGDSPEEMMGAFELYDDKKTGFITKATLKHCMQDFGPKLSDKEFSEMCKVADPKNTGKIDYKAFLVEMLG